MKSKKSFNLSTKQRIFLFFALILLAGGLYVIIKTYQNPCSSGDHFGNVTDNCTSCINSKCKKEKEAAKNTKTTEEKIKAFLEIGKCGCSKCDCNKELCADIGKGKDHVLKKIKKEPTKYYKMAKPLMN